MTSGRAEAGSSGALSDVATAAEEGADESGAVTVDPSGSARSELWPLLSQELGLTQEQEEKVRQVQRRLRENKEAWAEQRLLALLTVHLERLQMGLRSCAVRTQQRADTLQRVLSPTQVVHYLSWVNRNHDRLKQSRLEDSVIAAAAARLDEDLARLRLGDGGGGGVGGSVTDSMEVVNSPAVAAMGSGDVGTGGGSGVVGAAAFGRTPGPSSIQNASVVALLQKPSEELSLEDIEFLLNCVSKAPTSPVPVVQIKPEATASDDEGSGGMSGMDVADDAIGSS